MKSKMFYGWWMVIGCVLLITITVPFTSGLVSLYMLPVTEEFGIARSAFTLTTTILSSCTIVLSPFVSQIIEKYNLKLVLSVSLITFALAYMSYGLAQNVYHLYISAFIIGISFTFCSLLPVQILLVNWFNKSRGLAMSIAMGGIGAGGFLFSPIIAALIQNIGWRNTYFVMGAVVLVVGLPVIILIMKKNPQEIGLKPYGENEGEHATSDTEGSSDNTQKNRDIFIPADQVSKQNFFFVFLIGTFALGLITSGPLQQVNPYVSDLHGLTLGATIMSLYSLLGIFAKLLLGQLSDKLGIIPTGNIGYLTVIITFVLLLFGQYRVALFVMTAFWAFGNAVSSVSLPLFVTQTFGLTNSGRMLGLANSVFSIGMALGGVMVGAVYDLAGSYRLAWIGLIGITALSAFCINYASNASRKKFTETKI